MKLGEGPELMELVSKPFFERGNFSLHLGDARRLPLPDGSVHCAVTSPPYYGLRVYQGLLEAVWGGEQECIHQWAEEPVRLLRDNRNFQQGTQDEVLAHPTNTTHIRGRSKSTMALCGLCGAWRGHLGNEPNPGMYIQHLVECFREVKRVLRDDGALWVNIADTRGGGRGGAGSVGKKQLTSPGTLDLEPIGNDLNLYGIPERFVLAMQADGWIWRDVVIWSKPSSMPSSVDGWRWEKCRVKIKAAGRGRQPASSEAYFGVDHPRPDHSGDVTETAAWIDCPGCPKCIPNDGLVLRKGSWRTTPSHEYIFMFTKTGEYYGDKLGAAVPSKAGHSSGNKRRKTPREVGSVGDNDSGGAGLAHRGVSVPWNETELVNRRSVWTDIRPRPNSNKGKSINQRHFASFPPGLPEICIRASTSEMGCCPQCGMQWARVIERPTLPQVDGSDLDRYGDGSFGVHRKVGQAYQDWRTANPDRTLSWRPTCTCPPHKPVPSTILDPFSGTGTTPIVAVELGRRGIGVDLSEDYLVGSVVRLLRSYDEGQPILAS